MSGRGQFASAAGRWAGLGPYYAMFPMTFAESVIQRFTCTGGFVLDPFAGRGTSIYAAGRHGRRAVGVEINPVGWLYSNCKLRPAPEWEVLFRLTDIFNLSLRVSDDELRILPSFFKWCFGRKVLRFLVAARRELDWSSRKVDATLMAFILQDLHGNRGRALSNQMRQAKSMAPDYSVRWWKTRKMRPPNLDPREHIAKKILWRYKFGTPYFQNCRVLLGDSARRLGQLELLASKVDLLLTSPPYIGVTDYYYDQWLRIWMLDGPHSPLHLKTGTCKGDFDNQPHYRQMLLDVFASAAPLLKRGATVYVRTDARERTLTTTTEVLGTVFGNAAVKRAARPFKRRTQTHLFGDASKKPGEVDLCFTLPRTVSAQS